MIIGQCTALLQILKDKDSATYLSKAKEYGAAWKLDFKQPDSTWDVVHGKGLYEGTVWQYRWSVPHDVAGIIKLAGGKETFTKQLDCFFENNLYNHANEPDIQTPFLYNSLGQSWKTQRLVHKLLQETVTQRYAPHLLFKKPYTGKLYKTLPDGFIDEMDDDVGTMSSWYVLAAIGIYPALPGKPIFMWISPAFTKIQIKVSSNRTFEIECLNHNDGKHFYIQKATLNGKPLTRSWLGYTEIMAGGKLVFEMGPMPNTSWGTATPYIPTL